MNRGTPDAADTPLWNQCVALAGALGEAGILELTLTPPGLPARVLGTRSTDLPGVLIAGAPGTRVEATAMGLVIERAPHALVVVEARTPEARAIAAVLSA